MCTQKTWTFGENSLHFQASELTDFSLRPGHTRSLAAQVRLCLSLTPLRPTRLGVAGSPGHAPAPALRRPADPHFSRPSPAWKPALTALTQARQAGWRVTTQWTAAGCPSSRPLQPRGNSRETKQQLRCQGNGDAQAAQLPDKGFHPQLAGFVPCQGSLKLVIHHS